MMPSFPRLFIPALVLSAFLASCDPETTPKPRGYFRIDTPAHEYNPAGAPGCPFAFEIPVYARLIPDTNRLAEPCWWYLVFPQFHATLFLSYKPVHNNLVNFIEDARTLAYKHTVKADAITEQRIRTPNRVNGVFYDIGGNAASPFQFFVTDSTRHFLRGSLYFEAAPNSDSIAPVLAFIRNDIRHLIQTLQWTAPAQKNH